MRLLLLLGCASLVAACFDPHDPEFSGDAAPASNADADPGAPATDGPAGPAAEVTCGGIAGVRTINDEASWIGGNIVTVAGGVEFDPGGYLGSRWAFHMEGGRLTTSIEPTITSGLVLELLSPWAGSELRVKVDIAGTEVELRDHGSIMSTGEGDHDGEAVIEISVEDGLLRVASGSVGMTPVVIFEQPAPAWVRASYLRVERVDYFSGEAAPVLHEIVGHGPGAAPCKAEELVDPFDALDPITWRWTDGCTPTANGMLSVPIGGGAPSTCFVRAHYAYKLRGSRAALELPNLPGVVVALRAWNPGSNKSVRLAIVDDELRLLSGASSPWEIDETIHLDTSGIRWLALREAAGQLHWETSPDGVRWDDQFRAPVTLDLEHVVIGFDVEDDLGAGTAMIQGFGH